MPRRHDPLAVVTRLRRVRERDSALGLRQARHERDQADVRHQELAARLVAPEHTGTDLDVTGFVAHRDALIALGRDCAGARQQHATAASVAGAAQAHWQADRVRLEVIEALVERRAEQARAERLRVEARESDELAIATWSRRAESTR